jgi:hypothetical protein
MMFHCVLRDDLLCSLHGGLVLVYMVIPYVVYVMISYVFSMTIQYIVYMMIPCVAYVRAPYLARPVLELSYTYLITYSMEHIYS